MCVYDSLFGATETSSRIARFRYDALSAFKRTVADVAIMEHAYRLYAASRSAVDASKGKLKTHTCIAAAAGEGQLRENLLLYLALG